MFTLTIRTANAAFEDGPEFELARILRNAAIMLTSGDTDGVLHDYNGNTVGSWSLTTEEEN